jgi:hypothetical protein
MPHLRASIVSFYLGAIVFNASGLLGIVFRVAGVMFQRTILEFPFLFQSQRPLSSLPTECRALLGLTTSPHRKFNPPETSAFLLHVRLRALHPRGRSNVLSKSKIPLTTSRLTISDTPAKPRLSRQGPISCARPPFLPPYSNLGS